MEPKYLTGLKSLNGEFKYTVGEEGEYFVDHANGYDRVNDVIDALTNAINTYNTTRDDIRGMIQAYVLEEEVSLNQLLDYLTGGMGEALQTVSNKTKEVLEEMIAKLEAAEKTNEQLVEEQTEATNAIENGESTKTDGALNPGEEAPKDTTPTDTTPAETPTETPTATTATGTKDIETLRQELGLYDGTNGNSHINNKFGYYNEGLTNQQTQLLNSLDVYADSKGLTQQQKSDWAYIIGRESGFKTGASNGTHFGIGQLTAGNVQKYASDPTAYMNGDSAVQIEATYNYIMDRYGSIEAARAHWNSHNWY